MEGLLTISLDALSPRPLDILRIDGGLIEIPSTIQAGHPVPCTICSTQKPELCKSLMGFSSSIRVVQKNGPQISQTQGIRMTTTTALNGIQKGNEPKGHKDENPVFEENHHTSPGGQTRTRRHSFSSAALLSCFRRRTNRGVSCQ